MPLHLPRLRPPAERKSRWRSWKKISPPTSGIEPDCTCCRSGSLRQKLNVLLEIRFFKTRSSQIFLYTQVSHLFLGDTVVDCFWLLHRNFYEAAYCCSRFMLNFFFYCSKSWFSSICWGLKSMNTHQIDSPNTRSIPGRQRDNVALSVK